MAVRPGLLVFLIGIAVAAAVPGADAPSANKPIVSATATKTDVTVGEPFGVDVQGTGPEGTVFTFPDDPGNEKVDLRTPPPPPPVKGQTAAPPPPPPALRRKYDAAAFAVGEAEIPAIPVHYRLPDGTEGEVSTEPIALRIVSILPRDPKEQKLADIRGPVSLKIGDIFWISAGALLLLMIAGIFAWRSRRRRGDEESLPIEPVIAPDVEAILAIDELLSKGRLSREEYRLFYIELTEIAKRYLERRLVAPVLEMTSFEMVTFLRDNPYGRDLAPTMRDLSGAADQIKFARGAGLRLEAERHIAAARLMIASLEQRIAPQTKPQPGQEVA